MEKIIENLNTEIGKRVFRNWRMGMTCRDDIQNEYINQVAEYFAYHKQDTLDVAKDLLYLLNEIVPK